MFISKYHCHSTPILGNIRRTGWNHQNSYSQQNEKVTVLFVLNTTDQKISDSHAIGLRRMKNQVPE
jgi:hypothetical protein